MTSAVDLCTFNPRTALDSGIKICLESLLDSNDELCGFAANAFTKLISVESKGKGVNIQKITRLLTSDLQTNRQMALIFFRDALRANKITTPDLPSLLQKIPLLFDDSAVSLQGDAMEIIRLLVERGFGQNLLMAGIEKKVMQKMSDEITKDSFSNRVIDQGSDILKLLCQKGFQDQIIEEGALELLFQLFNIGSTKSSNYNIIQIMESIQQMLGTEWQQPLINHGGLPMLITGLALIDGFIVEYIIKLLDQIADAGFIQELIDNGALDALQKANAVDYVDMDHIPYPLVNEYAPKLIEKLQSEGH